MDEASSHQEANPRHRTDEVEIMSWAVRQAPSHSRQDTKAFRDVSKHHRDQTRTIG